MASSASVTVVDKVARGGIRALADVIGTGTGRKGHRRWLSVHECDIANAEMQVKEWLQKSGYQ